VNITGDLTEALNQGSEVFDIPDPSPLKKASPDA
jgi:hypothetical protein